MAEEKKQGGEPCISCAVCMKEIPGDVEHTIEGQEYVQHFCGLECYQKWHEKHEQEHGAEERKER